MFTHSRLAIASALVEVHAETGTTDAALVLGHLDDDPDPGIHAELLRCVAGIPDNASSDYADHYKHSLATYHARSNALAAAQGLAAELAEGGRQATADELLETIRTNLGSDNGNRETPGVALTVEDALAFDAAEVPWIIQGWLAARDVVLLAGEPGAGKSLIGLELAIALATGQPFLGTIPVQAPQRVLYIDEEQNTALGVRRLKRALTGHQAPTDAPLLYLAENGYNFDSATTGPLLENQISDFNPDIVIGDTLIRLHQRNENDNSNMSDLFVSKIRRLVNVHRTAFVGLHHYSKPSKDRPEAQHRVRGATDILAMADLVWTLEGDRSSTTRQLSQIKNRWGVPAKTLTTEYREDGDTATVTAQETSANAENIVLACLEDMGPTGALRADVVGALCAEGYTRVSASRVATSALGKLHGQGTVTREMQGRFARYWHRTWRQQLD